MKRSEKERIGKFVLMAAERDIRRKEAENGKGYFLNYERGVLECLASFLFKQNDLQTAIRGIRAAYWIGEGDEIHQTTGKYYLPNLEKRARDTKGGKRHVRRKGTRPKNTRT